MVVVPLIMEIGLYGFNEINYSFSIIRKLNDNV